MRAVWLADILESAGLTVIPYPGWETRGKDDFAPLGVMLHHTVTPAFEPIVKTDRFLATTGNATTPAPLCNYSTNRDGTISLIAAGTANHGGVGEWLDKSGNRFFFGDEMKNGGRLEPWPPVQLESARRAAAAVLLHIGSEPEWVCGHKEYALPAGRKTDPHTLNMNTERALIRELMEDDMTPEQAAQLEGVYKVLTEPLLGVGTNPTGPQAWVRTYNMVLGGELATDDDIAALAVEIKKNPKATVDALIAELND